LEQYSHHPGDTQGGADLPWPHAQPSVLKFRGTQQRKQLTEGIILDINARIYGHIEEHLLGEDIAESRSCLS
jgi:hypothetical protein